jgi:tight adherence protein B
MLWWRGASGIGGDGRRVNALRLWLDETGLAGHSIGAVGLGAVGIVALAASTMSALIPLPVVAPIAVCGSVVSLVAVLEGRRASRRQSARQVWPDVIESLRSALRSGSTVAEAFIDVAERVPERWRGPWQACAHELQRGVRFETAARKLKGSIADPTADTIIEALILAREVGGTELPRIVQSVADSVRAEARIRNEVRSRQSWVRHAARLGVAAPWIVLAMIASRPETRDALSSPTGSIIVVAGFGATVVAYFTMAGIARIPEQKRRLAVVGE